MRRIPPLASIRVFEAAARHENFTQAAAELGMTQAAVSYQIKVLEERLGLALFARSKRRVTLTEAGRKAAPLVSSAMDTMEDAFSGLVNDNEAVLGISTAQTFASAWLAPRLGTFQVGRPDLAVRLSTDHRLVDFASQDVDVAVRIGRGGWPGLARHFLFRSHLTPMCSPEFLERHPLQRASELLEVLRISPDDNWWRGWLALEGVEVPDGRQRTGIGLDSQITEVGAVLAGHGVALMTPLFWAAELTSGRLVQPFSSVHMPGNSYWLVYPEHKRMQHKIKAFREWLLAEIGTSTGDAPPEVFIEPVDIS